MKLGHIEIFVSDPMKAKAFYVDVLGFRHLDVQDESYIWLENGLFEALLRLCRIAPRPVSYQDASSAIVLYSSDLTRTRSELESKSLASLDTDNSDDCLMFCDPDGNWFQLVEHEQL